LKNMSDFAQSRGDYKNVFVEPSWVPILEGLVGKSFSGLTLVKRSNNLSSSGNVGTTVTASSRSDNFQRLIVSSYSAGNVYVPAESSTAVQGDGSHGRGIGDIVLAGCLKIHDGRVSGDWGGSVTSVVCMSGRATRSLNALETAIPTAPGTYGGILETGHTQSSVQPFGLYGSQKSEKTRNTVIYDKNVNFPQMNRLGFQGYINTKMEGFGTSVIVTSGAPVTTSGGSTKALALWSQSTGDGKPILGFVHGSVSLGITSSAPAVTTSVIELIGYSPDIGETVLASRTINVAAIVITNQVHFTFSSETTTCRCFSAMSIRITTAGANVVTSYAEGELDVSGAPYDSAVDSKLMILDGLGTVVKDSIKFTHDEYVLTRSTVNTHVYDHDLDHLSELFVEHSV